VDEVDEVDETSPSADAASATVPVDGPDLGPTETSHVGPYVTTTTRTPDRTEVCVGGADPGHGLCGGRLRHRVKVELTAIAGALDPSVVRKAMHRVHFGDCLVGVEPSDRTAELDLSVGARGGVAVHFTKPTGVAPIDACIADLASSIPFPAAGAMTTVNVSLALHVDPP
jgi:hypothetical protein